MRAATKRVWWSRNFVQRELYPAVTFGIFVGFAASDWIWGFVAGWGFGVILSRIEDVIEKIND